MSKRYEAVPELCGSLPLAIAYNPDTGALTWRATGKSAGSRMTIGYRRVQYLGLAWPAHRLAWFLHYGEWPKGQIDHIDGDRANNRISNLRDADSFTNQQNRQAPAKGTRLGLVGVTRTTSAASPFGAQIKVGGKNLWLGSFKTPEEARAAYLSAKVKHHPGYVKGPQ